MKSIHQSNEDVFISIVYDDKIVNYSVTGNNSSTNYDMVLEKAFNLPRSEVKQPKRLLNRLVKNWSKNNAPKNI